VFADILTVSQARNAERGITGCLLSCNGWFMQVLEGGGNDVQSVYDSIQRDARHADVRLVRFGRARERRFARWSMCGKVLSPTDRAIVAVFEEGGAFDPGRLTVPRAVALLLQVQELQSKYGEDPMFLD
jgi:hypothetical protein